MVSRKQELEKQRKVCEVVKAFLDNNGSNIKISEETNISKSSVQRYLKDKIIIELFGQETYDQIQLKLKENTLLARSKGGTNFALNNTSAKDSSGRFIGSRKK